MSDFDSDHDIYPMPLFPQLTVSNVEESTAWYEALGFDVIYSMPVMAHVRYRKYADVMLVADRSEGDADAETTRGNGVAIYLTVEDEAIDDVAERAEETGADVVAPPHETGWNTRETTVRDPDGYELVFSERTETDRSFEDVMGSSDA
ncbi:hypothetical protein BG842_19815 [Haladaptatus sp. W1]|uniref:VOC family protein n=1 Tax=Haladaptatus sp. W1 TaxID=1897478 RepID=UPI000849EAFE|nr:VOC family protein [Haladaptatus sp. W1]ODR82834.1 hypothetical protein BG842_19815 [Haladaptatus sp. W1]